MLRRRHFGIIGKLYTMKVAPKHKVVCSIVWVEEVHTVVVVATTHMWVHFEKGVPGRFVSRRASKSKAGRMRRGCCHRGQKALLLLSSLLREVALALLLVLLLSSRASATTTVASAAAKQLLLVVQLLLHSIPNLVGQWQLKQKHVQH